MCVGQSPCESSQLNSLRLNNNGVFSSITSAGRVEICVCIDISNTICRWQTVSTGSTTEPISWKNSIVVCRDLGYQDVQSPILQSTYVHHYNSHYTHIHYYCRCLCVSACHCNSHMEYCIMLHVAHFIIMGIVSYCILSLKCI